jgi:trk system potassium uptake protein TrkH
MSTGAAIWNGIFHSVSAFCNAGFDLMGRFEAYSSLTYYAEDVVVNITLMLLIVVGGIGFIVWDDLLKHRFHIKQYMLHTKIVLTATAVLIFGGALLFFLFERENVLAEMTPKGQVLSSLFASVTARTAGFNTTDTGSYTQPARLLTMVLMFIGGSPGSTAGGVKTTTMVVLLLLAVSTVRNRTDLTIFQRRLDGEAVKKASTVFLINLFLAVISILAISAIQPFSLDDVMFEVFSAIGTAGITTGITRDLTFASRYIIIVLMYCGRIGSMSFALSFMEKKQPAEVRLPQERITIG